MWLSRRLACLPLRAIAVGIAALASALAPACGESETATHTPFNQLVAATECASCAVEAGKLYCWGRLAPEPAPSSPPKEITLPKPAVMVALGKDHGCALLDEEAGLYCWGANESGQLGSPPSGDPMEQVTKPQKSNFPAGVTQLVLGEGFTCALASGSVKCAGGRIDGTLGNGRDPMDDNLPLHSDVPLGIPGISNTRAIAGGNDFTCSLDNAGVVDCWGKNEHGQCGQMDNDTVLFPLHVDVPTADAIYAGTAMACAHTKAGEVYCWGDNGAGVFGDMSPGGNTPTKVALDKYASLALGATRGCGLLPAGTVECWGRELAKNPMKNDPPTPVTALTKPNAFAAGFDHDCAWDGGYLYCWGLNGCGQVAGIGAIVPEPTPVVLHAPPGGGGSGPGSTSSSGSGSGSTGSN